MATSHIARRSAQPRPCRLFGMSLRPAQGVLPNLRRVSPLLARLLRSDERTTLRPAAVITSTAARSRRLRAEDGYAPRYRESLPLVRICGLEHFLEVSVSARMQ